MYLTDSAERNMSAHTRTLVIQDKLAFVGFNRPHFNIPIKVYPGHLTPAQQRMLQWSHPKFPYLAFVPTAPAFYGRLFERLQVYGNSEKVAHELSLVTQQEMDVPKQWY